MFLNLCSINICWLNHPPLPTAIGSPKWWRNGSGQHLLNVKIGACASYAPTSHHWSSRGLRCRNIPQTHWQAKRLDILSPTWRLQPMPVCIEIWHHNCAKRLCWTCYHPPAVWMQKLSKTHSIPCQHQKTRGLKSLGNNTGIEHRINKQQLISVFINCKFDD